MAHVRWEFYNFYESLELPMAGEAVLHIRKLYDVETQARGLPPAERVALRQETAKPILDDLEVWLKEQLGKICGKTPLAEAIKYALARMPKARPYLDNGFLKSTTTQPNVQCALWRWDVKTICSWDQKRVANRPPSHTR